MNITIIATNWQLHSDMLQQIRHKVFIQEQQISIADEWDEHDETAIHFLVINDQHQAIGCARLLNEGDLFHIGRVAVLAEYRSQSFGRQLMQFVLCWCKQANPECKIYLHAQISKLRFYQYLGFVACGDIFMDAGIEHTEMWYQHFPENDL